MLYILPRPRGGTTGSPARNGCLEGWPFRTVLAQGFTLTKVMVKGRRSLCNARITFNNHYIVRKARVLPGIITEVRGWPSRRDSDAPQIAFSTQDRMELMRLAQIITFQTSGSLMFSQGDEAAFVYLLTSGVVASYYTLRNGERQILEFRWSGDMVGLAENGRYASSAQTLEPAQLLRFPVAGLEQFLVEHPQVQNSFMVRAIHDIHRMQRQVIMMGKLDIPRRLALFLVECSTHKPYFSQKSGILTLPMSRDDIADYLGASPETVIRALSRLQRSGMVERISPRELRLYQDRLSVYVGLDLQPAAQVPIV